MKSVDEILDKIKELKGLKKGHGSDVALGKALKIKKQAITNWKYRKEVAWRTLMDALPAEEFRKVYEWALGGVAEPAEVEPSAPSFKSKGIEASDLEAAERIVEDLLKGRSLSNELRHRLVSLVLDELLSLRAQDRENELHRKIERWIEAAQILRSKPKSQ